MGTTLDLGAMFPTRLQCGIGAASEHESERRALSRLKPCRRGLLVSKRLNRVHPRGSVRGVVAERDADADADARSKRH